MRITIWALVEGIDGEAPRAEMIGVVKRDADDAPASGLGLYLRETRALLRQLQAVVVREQVAQFVVRESCCRRCGGCLATKDSKTIPQCSGCRAATPA